MVRDRSAKPGTAVRVRQVPQSLLKLSRLFSCVEDTLFYLPHMQCGAETQPMLVLSVSETRYIGLTGSTLPEVMVSQPMLVLSVSETRYISWSPTLQV